MRAYVLNKPPGCITATVDFAGRATVYDHVPTHFPRLPHVGRLDYASEGLLLFTDDGRLQQALLDKDFVPGRPPVAKAYEVKVRDRLEPDDERIARMELPLDYPGKAPTQPARVRFLLHRTRATWLEVVITEGRHHQVRHLCARSGFPVLKLRRVRLGPLELGDLKLRWCRPVTADEWAALYAAALPNEALPSLEPIDDSADARANRPGAPPDPA
jgi:23S rRNA pseudouridine2605 synthase